MKCMPPSGQCNHLLQTEVPLYATLKVEHVIYSPQFELLELCTNTLDYVTEQEAKEWSP